MITTILIAVGIFIYLVIGAFLDYKFDIESVGFIMFWPIVIPIIGAIEVGYSIATWFEKRKYKKLFGGKGDDKN